MRGDMTGESLLVDDGAEIKSLSVKEVKEMMESQAQAAFGRPAAEVIKLVRSGHLPPTLAASNILIMSSLLRHGGALKSERVESFALDGNGAESKIVFYPATAAELVLPAPMYNELYGIYDVDQVTDSYVLAVAYIGKPSRTGLNAVAWVCQFWYRGSTFYDCGTVTKAKLRGQGLGSKYWAELLNMVQPQTVNVITVSRGGEALITRIKEQFQHINWRHTRVDPKTGRRTGSEYRRASKEPTPILEADEVWR
jgi:predicted GNAT family acetyltransferase